MTKPIMKFMLPILLTLLLASCAPTALSGDGLLPANPAASQPTISLPAAQPAKPEPVISPTVPICAFVEGRMPLTELSSQFTEKLKNAGLPVAAARAEAYGENCVAEDGSLVRFSARETDFYITLEVKNLSDQAALGELAAKALDVIEQFPIQQTSGPNPGYIGITFTAGTEIQNLWFTRVRGNELRKQGLKGADLFNSLKNKP